MNESQNTGDHCDTTVCTTKSSNTCILTASGFCACRVGVEATVDQAAVVGRLLGCAVPSASRSGSLGAVSPAVRGRRGRHVTRRSMPLGLAIEPTLCISPAGFLGAVPVRALRASYLLSPGNPLQDTLSPVSQVRSHTHRAPDGHARCWEFISRACVLECVLEEQRTNLTFQTAAACCKDNKTG